MGRSSRLLNNIKNFLFNRLHFLKVPELDLHDEAKKEFEHIFEKWIAQGEGETIEYTSKLPKSQFLTHLLETKNILVHGSNHPSIHVFEPRSQNLFNGKPVKAVFASSDGIWSLFFAVIDREKHKGSLRNMCLSVPTKNGIKRYYYFSIHKNAEDVWSNGTIYFLSKDKFKQGGIKDEWISEQEVKPLAKLQVTPEDFPFIKDVKRHDEADSIFKTWFKILILGR